MIGEGVRDEVCDVAVEENGAIRGVAGNGLLSNIGPQQ
jgi:hypothetical protein